MALPPFKCISRQSEIVKEKKKKEGEPQKMLTSESSQSLNDSAGSIEAAKPRPSASLRRLCIPISIKSPPHTHPPSPLPRSLPAWRYHFKSAPLMFRRSDRLSARQKKKKKQNRKNIWPLLSWDNLRGDEPGITLIDLGPSI